MRGDINYTLVRIFIGRLEYYAGINKFQYL